MQRFAYISTIIQPTSGVLNKLERQARTAQEGNIPIDFYWTGKAAAVKTEAYPSLRLEPLPQTLNSFQIRKRQAERVNALLDEYDKVILRYTQWDPITHVSLNDKKRVILELHTRYLTELRSERSWRYPFELAFSSWLRPFGGLTGVSPEIVASEVRRSGYEGKTTVIPNSINVSSFEVADEPLWKAGETLKLIMVASQFYAWQGLELILADIAKATRNDFELHLVGQLTPEQAQLADAQPQVISHGLKPVDELKNMYQDMHAGLSFFNLAHKKMTSTSALKVCEYLAAGIPVISAHHDSALPEGFEYELVTPNFDVQRIHSFMQSIAQTSRTTIQAAAHPYIDSLVNTKLLYDFCASLPPKA